MTAKTREEMEKRSARLAGEVGMDWEIHLGNMQRFEQSLPDFGIEYIKHLPPASTIDPATATDEQIQVYISALQFLTIAENFEEAAKVSRALEPWTKQFPEILQLREKFANEFNLIESA